MHDIFSPSVITILAEIPQPISAEIFRYDSKEDIMAKAKQEVRYVFVDENTKEELEVLLRQIIITKIAKLSEVERKNIDAGV